MRSHVALDAEESAKRANDERNYNRGHTATIDARTDRYRHLRHDDADNATDRHQPAKNCDDHPPVRVPRVV